MRIEIVWSGIWLIHLARTHICIQGLIIVLYTDNMVIFGCKEDEISKVKKKLKEFYLITDSSLVNKLLGIHFTWGQDKSIHLDQESHTSQIDP